MNFFLKFMISAAKLGRCLCFYLDVYDMCIMHGKFEVFPGCPSVCLFFLSVDLRLTEKLAIMQKAVIMDLVLSHLVDSLLHSS